MNLPQNTNLPFFDYGNFKHGQIAFFKIKKHVASYKQVTVDALMQIRDGIPVLKTDATNTIYGDVIYFREDEAKMAYEVISSMAIGKQYKWATLKTKVGEANVLLSNTVGHADFCENNTWDCWQDPLFTTVFKIIDEQLKSKTELLNGEEFLKLQMCYLLLWSGIERYAALRYKLVHNEAIKIILKIGDEDGYREAFQKHCKVDTRKIWDSGPDTKARELKSSFYDESLRYYYRLRSNITHRGKTAISDAKLVRKVLTELSCVFKDMLTAAKIEAEYNP